MIGDEGRQLFVQGKFHIAGPGVAQNQNKDVDSNQVASQINLFCSPVHLGLKPGRGFKAYRSRFNLPVGFPKWANRFFYQGVAPVVAFFL